MTEELKQRAEEYAINMWGNDEAFIDERNNCKQDYIAGATELQIELKRQIADLKDYVLKVSKFLHNNSNVRPDKLAYHERDKLLIKELKLFEKWELSK